MFNNFFKFLFTAVLVSSYSQLAYPNKSEIIVPLNAGAWVALSYNKIPANKVTFSDNSLSARVKSSAGPIVHKLSGTMKITEFLVKGKISGSKKIESGSFDEDSALRFGLVAVGQQTLSGPKKWFAADWVKKLFSLAPEGTGLDKIYFYNLTNRAELVGKSRAHPKSDLMVETILTEVNKSGSFELNRKLDSPVASAAIWISIDGDDSKSEYETTISEIKLMVAP